MKAPKDKTRRQTIMKLVDNGLWHSNQKFTDTQVVAQSLLLLETIRTDENIYTLDGYFIKYFDKVIVPLSNYNVRFPNIPEADENHQNAKKIIKDRIQTGVLTGKLRDGAFAKWLLQAGYGMSGDKQEIEISSKQYQFKINQPDDQKLLEDNNEQNS